MRAVLLEGSSYITNQLDGACRTVGLPLAKVTSPAAFLNATSETRGIAAAFLDCSVDAGRWTAALAQPTAPLFIIHDGEELRRAFGTLAPPSATWLPAAIRLPDLLDLLQDALDDACRATLRRMHGQPTARQEAVLDFFAARLSHARIATALGIRPCTVQVHLRRLMERFEVDHSEELRAIHRFLTTDPAAARPWHRHDQEPAGRRTARSAG